MNWQLFRILLRPAGRLQGEVRQPTTNDPLPGTINGQARLSETEVRSIISYAADRARTTRAGIRLPIGIHMEVFITVVNNPNQPGVEPTVLGTFRAGEATMFSWDVAVQKARTALYYSSRDLLGFGGISRCISGCSPDPNLPNGITIFPGGFPLYRNGVLIGAIGISGDGVDQDDFVGASGMHERGCDTSCIHRNIRQHVDPCRNCEWRESINSRLYYCRCWFQTNSHLRAGAFPGRFWTNCDVTGSCS